MLSPTRITYSYLKRLWNATIWSASSYWTRSPLPKSPRTANLNDPSTFGSPTGGVARVCSSSTVAGPAVGRGPQLVSARARASNRKRRGSSRADRWRMLDLLPFLLGQGVRDEIRDDVRMRIEQDQPVANEPVLEILAELGQDLQHGRGNGGQRHRIGVAGVDR